MKLNLILIAIIFLLVLVLGGIVARSCNKNDGGFSFVVSMPDPQIVGVDSVYIDTVFLDNSNNQASQRVNFYHSDSIIEIKGFTMSQPPSCSIQYVVKPIVGNFLQHGDSLIISGAPDPYTITITENSLNNNSSSNGTTNVRLGVLLSSQGEKIYYLGIGKMFFDLITLETGVMSNGFAGIFVSYNF